MRADSVAKNHPLHKGPGPKCAHGEAGYVFGLPKDRAKNVHIALLPFWLPEV
jgi:hypothetical protein